MYASLRYIDANAPVMAIPGQAYNVGASTQDDDGDDVENIAEPDRTEQLKALAPALHELSSDIMFKYSQIKDVLDSLPGVGVSEKEQRAQIAELDAQLKVKEEDRAQAFKVWQQLMERVNAVATLGQQ